MFLESEIPDVDLDVKRRDLAISSLRDYVQASQINKGKMVAHNSGVYFQKIPVDPTSGLAAFPYKIAEEIGYFKIDLIPNHVYDLVESNEELDALLAAPVDWGWFQDERFFKSDDKRYQLTHLSGYHHLCVMYPPKSIEDVAYLVAIKLPGKVHLIGQPWATVKKEMWIKNADDAYSFKKSHSVAFAMLVVLHAQLIARHLGEAEEYFI
jgi:hypothetical protein